MGSTTLDVDLFQEEVAPLFEVHLELSDSTVQYRPSLDTADDNSFLKLMESLLRDTYSSAARVPRLLEGQLNYEVGPGRVAAPGSAGGG